MQANNSAACVCIYREQLLIVNASQETWKRKNNAAWLWHRRRAAILIRQRKILTSSKIFRAQSHRDAGQPAYIPCCHNERALYPSCPLSDQQIWHAAEVHSLFLGDDGSYIVQWHRGDMTNGKNLTRKSIRIVKALHRQTVSKLSKDRKLPSSESTKEQLTTKSDEKICWSTCNNRYRWYRSITWLWPK